MIAKTIQKIEEFNKCPKCRSEELIIDQNRAELFCNNCGLVIDDNQIDYSPEWRAFNHEQVEKRARTGLPMTPLIHDKGLSTTIGWKNRDSYGRIIPQRNRAQLYRIRKWQSRIRFNGCAERNLAEALRSLDRISSALNLPRTSRENAAIIYRKAVSKNLIRGRSIEGLVAAAIYAACRRCNIPRTLREIHNKSDIPVKVIGRNYRFLTRELQLKLLPTSPQDYLPRFCNKLKLSKKTQDKAKEIIEKASEKELTSGKSPSGVAAATIYMAAILCDERRTQAEVADISGVTEVTIRNNYKVLSNELNIIIII
jgi:transcription initiation factor TFIIB